MQSLKISELFKSIQGETTYAGLQCTFIRLAGCNLECKWCDTKYSRNTEDFEKYTVSELSSFAESSKARLICITGGEPLLQKNVSCLIDKLIELNYLILLETNGSINVSEVPKEVIKIIDVKTPSSGEKASFETENLNYLNRNDQLKFIIADLDDYCWSKNFLKTHNLFSKAEIIFSPLYGKIRYSDLAEWILNDSLQVRMQLQLHKLIWPDKKRGV